MTAENAPTCPVCCQPLSVRLAHGRKSGKPFLMLVCVIDGRHFRGFISDRRYVQQLIDKLEVMQGGRAGAGRSSATEEAPTETTSFVPKRGEAVAVHRHPRVGRPRVTERPGFGAHFGAVSERLRNGEISRRRAARELGVGYASLKRLLDGRQEVQHDTA